MAALAGLAALSGCPGGRCTFNGDCPGQSFCDQAVGRCITECFDNADCKNRPGCASTPEGCDPIGIVCRDGRCQGEEGTGPDARVGAEDDGWDAPAFSGPVFVIDSLKLADERAGFDIVGSTHRGIDNRLALLAPFANDAVQSGLRQGATILLMEIAGLLPDFEGDDYAVTVKFYAAEDADNRPDNNFRPPAPGEACCTFRPLGTSLVTDGLGQPQAITRANARIEGGVLRSLRGFSVNLQVELGNPQPETIVINNARLQLQVPPSLERLESGMLGGAVPMRSLGLIDNPYCRTPSVGCPPVSEQGSLLDIVSAIAGPADIDLDNDRLECVWDTDGDYEFDLCCEGRSVTGACVDGSACAGTTIESSDPADPRQCILRQGFEDGYSAALELTAVKAEIL